MKKENKVDRLIAKGAPPPIITQFDNKRGKQFEEKSDTTTNDPFIKNILDITKDLPESPKP